MTAAPFAKRCPACSGIGQYIEEYIAESPRYEDCGYCRGSGYIKNKTLFYRVLGWISGEARRKLKYGNRNQVLH